MASRRFDFEISKLKVFVVLHISSEQTMQAAAALYKRSTDDLETFDKVLHIARAGFTAPTALVIRRLTTELQEKGLVDLARSGIPHICIYICPWFCGILE